MPKKGSVARRVGPVVPLAIALLMQNAVLPPKRGSAKPPKDSTLAVAVCEDVENENDCHTRYPTGCTNSGAYDTYLNLLKNQVSFPASSPSAFFSSADQLDTLEQKIQALPKKLGRTNHLEMKDALAGMGEGQLRGAVGFLYSVKPENTGNGETSNCKLHDKQSDVDFHIGIGFDSDLASRIREAASHGKKLTPAEKAKIKHTTFIVEMTPHFRARFHTGWTADSLQKVIGRQVKVTGQLMADSEHNVSSQNCGVAGSTSDCWRATIWELHPVTDFQVCHSSNSCDLSSSDWKDLEQESPSEGTDDNE